MDYKDNKIMVERCWNHEEVELQNNVITSMIRRAHRRGICPHQVVSQRKPSRVWQPSQARQSWRVDEGGRKREKLGQQPLAEENAVTEDSLSQLVPYAASLLFQF